MPIITRPTGGIKLPPAYTEVSGQIVADTASFVLNAAASPATIIHLPEIPNNLLTPNMDPAA